MLRPSFFAITYRNMGSLIIAVLGLVGVSIGWPALQAQIKTTIETQISQQVKEPVTDAQKVAEEAEKLADHSRRAVDTGLKEIRYKQTRITDTLGRLDARSEDLNGTFAKVDAQIDQLDQNAEDLQQRMDTFNEQFKFNLATQDDVNAIYKDLSSLAAKSRDLAAAVQKIQEPSGTSDKKIALVSSFDDVASQVKERSEAVSTTKSTVYIQFAGGRREDIKTVSEELKLQDWLVPGEERTPKAVDLKEVRYFHTQDEKAAEKLAADTNTALEANGFGSIIVSAKDSTNYPKPPRQGVLELWVDISLR